MPRLGSFRFRGEWRHPSGERTPIGDRSTRNLSVPHHVGAALRRAADARGVTMRELVDELIETGIRK